ncbi:1-deoxy-D-xylulose-5-phosphate synthase [Caldicellulosiruptor changbaiensis]|uniref:1-deoxy-D-xylulose-5-phosphate synthase n=1 Tax=Caldicellulosiruptor changbaiensis TaxID=1222016 RepID=A0A3T0D5Y3_9FIRM|nr:1-deoxy-D-xylulose-5-phosphate synthase [Caldicellulosiruptor changbaiensis]AZT90418.1 1-deoxy-D-xylulose-5-phosphate synthase [Caldicellulosiruptor changbaiensis]
MSILEKVNYPEDIKKLSISELYTLSEEIREFLLYNIANTGGHLAANLGVVELTLALLYTFNPPEDKIVWDVGHQCYVYKILTGRKERFATLRKLGGLSGFPKSKESIYDSFDTGHSSTSISVALGFAIARDLNHKDYNVIAVIGDGALTGGLAYEGLNNAGRYNGKLLVILNDNQMSISKNVGAIAKYLSKVRTQPRYFKLKKATDELVANIPFIGEKLNQLVRKLKGGLKYILFPGMLFEALGFEYYGPIDGHDIKKMCEVFENVKNLTKPVLVHIVTQKGKGYEHAERFPEKYHGVPPFDIETGNHLTDTNSKSFSEVLGDKLCELAKENQKIVGITAAMPDGTGLTKFAKMYPERFFDVGIAEEHAVTFAAALAKEGFKPFVAIYSTFLQRAFDQIIHDVCLQNLNVVFCIDRAGLVGEDGETHHGSFDISYLTLIPNLTVMAPKDTKEFEMMLDFAAAYHDGPIAIRYPRGTTKIVGVYEPILFGKSEILVEGSNLAIFTVGRHVSMLYDIIKENNLNVTLINVRFLKPLDVELVEKITKTHKKILIVEDNTVIGGLGEKIKGIIAEINSLNLVKHIGLLDKFIQHGSISELYSLLGLDKENLKNVIMELIAD